MSTKPIVNEALDICKEISNMVEQLPEQAEDFGQSVESKMLSIRDWIEKNDHATDKQVNALENMHAGLKKWVDK